MYGNTTLIQYTFSDQMAALVWKMIFCTENDLLYFKFSQYEVAKIKHFRI